MRFVLVLLFSIVSVVSATAASAFDFNWEGSHADGLHTRYVPAVSNPLFNETPYITTELRAVYLHNKIPSDFLSRGGILNVVAAELRLALNDRLGIIASKDGYVDANFKSALRDDSAFVNLSLGLKYALVSDPATDSILTIGAEYEPPTGNLRTGNIHMQGRGGGFMNLFATGARAFGKLGVQGSAGVNLALDGDNDSSMFHYSAHVDYEAAPGFYPLLEFNGFTTIDEGNRTPLDFEGVDLVNFGSTESGTVLTAAAGFRYHFNRHLQMGAAYERAVSGRKDILDERYTFDLIVRY